MADLLADAARAKEREAALVHQVVASESDDENPMLAQLFGSAAKARPTDDPENCRLILALELVHQQLDASKLDVIEEAEFGCILERRLCRTQRMVAAHVRGQALQKQLATDVIEEAEFAEEQQRHVASVLHEIEMLRELSASEQGGNKAELTQLRTEIERLSLALDEAEKLAEQQQKALLEARAEAAVAPVRPEYSKRIAAKNHNAVLPCRAVARQR